MKGKNNAGIIIAIIAAATAGAAGSEEILVTDSGAELVTHLGDQLVTGFQFFDLVSDGAAEFVTDAGANLQAAREPEQG